MRILTSVNLLLLLIVIVNVLLIWQHQVLVQYDVDEMVHWIPVRTNSTPILLPLEKGRAGTYYQVQLHFSEAVDDGERDFDSSVHVHGEDLNGNVFDVFAGDIAFKADGRTAMIPIEAREPNVTYLAVDLDAELRSQVALVGVSASIPEIKARSVDASITRDATRNALFLLGMMLLIQIVLLFGLIRQRQRHAKTRTADDLPHENLAKT